MSLKEVQLARRKIIYVNLPKIYKGLDLWCGDVAGNCLVGVM